MSPEYQAPDVYRDEELLNRLGYGIVDIPFRSGVGFEDVYRFAYMVQPERDPNFHSHVLFQILGKRFERRMADAMWTEILRHKWLLSEEAGKDVGIEAAAKDWYERHGPQFEKHWYLTKPQVPRRFPHKKEGGPGLPEKALGAILPPLKELLEAGFSAVDIISVSRRFPGEVLHTLLLHRVPEEERERFYVRLIARLVGYELGEEEALRAWGEILEHKWYMSEQKGRDVGIRAAALDYFKRLRLAET